MNEKTYRSCQAIGLVLVALAFIIGVKISNPSQPPASPQPSSPAEVTSKTAATPSSPKDEMVVAISYEREGDLNTMRAFAFHTEGDKFIYSPISGFPMVRKSGISLSTTHLIPAEKPGAFWWVAMNMRSSESTLLRFIPGNEGSVPEMRIGHCASLAQLGEDKLVSLQGMAPNRELVIRSFEEHKSTHPLPGPNTFTDLIPVRSESKVIGLCWSEVYEQGLAGNQFYYKPLNSQNLLAQRTGFFPTAVTTRGNQAFAFGMTPRRGFRMRRFVLSDTNMHVHAEEELTFPSPPRSIGIGHAFVHVDKASGKEIATLLFWDAPMIVQYDLTAKRHVVSHAFTNLFNQEVRRPAVKQTVVLDYPNHWFAFTIQAIDQAGNPISALVIAHENHWSVMHVSGVSNGLTTTGNWIAWDIRSSLPMGVDQIALINLAGPKVVPDGHIALGNSSGKRQLTSPMALNRR